MPKRSTVTDRAREMYGEHQYGDFSYGREREQYYPLLFEAIGRYEPGGMLYDIGSGTGFWADAYTEAGIPPDRAVFVELSEKLVSRMHDKGLRAQVGNVLDLDIEDNTSDITICNGVIHHTADPFQAFSELVRITRPGGVVFLSVYNKFHPYFYLVHRGAFPFRYVYWNHTKSVIHMIYPPAALLLQTAYLLKTGRFVDRKTLKTKFMDEVMTPRAALFSKSDLRDYAERCDATVEAFDYFTGYTMIQALIQT